MDLSTVRSLAASLANSEADIVYCGTPSNNTITLSFVLANVSSKSKTLIPFLGLFIFSAFILVPNEYIITAEQTTESDPQDMVQAAEAIPADTPPGAAVWDSFTDNLDRVI